MLLVCTHSTLVDCIIVVAEIFPVIDGRVGGSAWVVFSTGLFVSTGGHLLGHFGARRGKPSTHAVIYYAATTIDFGSVD